MDNYPPYQAIAGGYEAKTGFGIHPENAGKDLSGGERFAAGFNASIAAVETIGLATGLKAAAEGFSIKTGVVEESAKVTMDHGTTLTRAENLAKSGPDSNFVEPGGLPTSEGAQGFSAAKPEGPFPMGSPSDYALGKAAAFPDEGGPAILRMTMPKEQADFGLDVGGEVRFNKAGTDALKFDWDKVTGVRLTE